MVEHSSEPERSAEGARRGPEQACSRSERACSEPQTDRWPGARLDRRQFVTTAGLALAACRGQPEGERADDDALDRLFTAHSNLPPENSAGANHYPMAAEAMTTLGSHTIPSEWHAGARYYRAELARDESGGTGDPALGERDRHGDWLDHFRRELERQPWREALGQWVPVLAPGLGGAMFHGLIRTAHAVRALRRRTSRARQDELAAGLAYWASCYTTLPTHDHEIGASDIDARYLADLEHPWLADRRDVDFHATMARLTANPLTPRVRTTTPADPARELRGLLRAAATAFLEMLVQERHRIWLLHGFTGPAAIDLLLPELSAATGQGLVKHAAQATIALFAAYGAPFEPGAHVRGAALPWAALAQEAIARRSIHGLKLIEALRRSDDDADLLLRSVAAQWLEWV